MKFLKGFLINFAVIVAGLLVIYLIGHDLLNLGFEFFKAILGSGRTFLFLFLLIAIAALPRRGWKR